MDQPQHPARIVITDIDMPFTSLVSFMIKLALASIPATMIVSLVLFATWLAGSLVLVIAAAAIGVLGQ
jgi:hypothetical protein